MRRFFTFLLSLLLSCSFLTAYASTEIIYGQSELGRDLICHQIGTEDAVFSLLMVFGIHGFEDIYDHDAEILREIAETIIHHYDEYPPENACLYIIPSANPDGLIDGFSCNDFGRLTALQIDPNRDFPCWWEDNSRTTNLRYRTGTEPFSTAEARAIRDFTLSVMPDWGMDVHGYINAVYGDGAMARTFSSAMDMMKKQCSSGGMMCEWFDEVLEEGIMIELPAFKPESFDREGYVQYNAGRIIRGVDAWLERNGTMNK